jgi:Helix-turn-helix domain
MAVGVYDTVRLLEYAPSSARVVWLVLATIRDGANEAHASLATLEELTGLAPGRVESAVRTLARLGLIEGAYPVFKLLTLFAVSPAPASPDLPFAMPPLPPAEPVVTPATLMQAWNLGATHLHPCRVLTPTRKERAWARLKQNPDVNWHFVIARLDASSFCRGQNSSGWKAGFDFLLKEATVTKVLEGIYDDTPPTPVSTGNARAAAAWLTHRRKHA